MMRRDPILYAASLFTAIVMGFATGVIGMRNVVAAQSLGIVRIAHASPRHDDTEINVKAYGASGSARVTTGTVSAHSNLLTVTNPIDFKDGMGIFIPNAGPPSNLRTPAAPTVTIGGGPSGTSSYGYRIVALDGLGGGSAASAEAVIRNGPSRLGGLGANGAGSGGDINHAAWFSLTVPTGAVGTRGAYAIYRTTVPSGSTLQTGFIGIYSYTNAPFLDYGQRIKTPPPGIPIIPSDLPFSDAYVATIRSGGGTRILLLSVPVTTPISGGRIYHDDTESFSRALHQNPSRLYVPRGSYGISSALNYHEENGLFFGDGASSVLRYQGNADATLMLSASGITVRNISFNGQKTSYQLVGVGDSTRALRDITIRDTAGYSSNFYGIHISNRNNNINLWYSNVELSDNSYEDCEYAYATNGNVQNLLIAGNRLSFSDYNYSGRGISLHNSSTTQGYAYARNFVISDNVLRVGNHSAAIVIQGSGSGTITGNYLIISGGIYAFWGMGAGRDVGASGSYIFSNNVCKALWADTGVAVNLTNTLDVSVRYNTLTGFGYGFEVGGYGGPAFPDSVNNRVVLANNQLYNIKYSPFLGPVPMSVQMYSNQSLKT